MKLKWRIAVAVLAMGYAFGSPTRAFAAGESLSACGVSVSVFDDEVALRFRQELRESTETYLQNFGDVAFASNLVPGIAPELEDPPPAAPFLDDHIISFGSGPDIMRPLYNFPFARHYHLLDVMEGWYGGGEMAFQELERRLRHLHPEIEVTLVERGFLEKGLPEMLDRIPPSNFVSGTGPYQGVVTWRLEWPSTAAGHQQKFVSLHLKDYHRENERRDILKQIPRGRLGGMFITHARLPRGQALPDYLKHLKLGGLFIAELDFLNSAGRSSTAAEDVISRAVISTMGLKVDRIFPRNDELAAAIPDSFFPQTYRFERTDVSMFAEPN